MSAAGRPGRGERARVAARVRDLLADAESAGRAHGMEPLPAQTERLPADDARAPWVPGSGFDRHVPQHGDVPGRGWRQRLRWDPGRKGATALGAAVVAVVAATGWWLAASRPREVPISAAIGHSSPARSAHSSFAAPRTSPRSAGPAASSPAGGAPLIVDVAGKVRRPGIYTLPAGARIYDAVRAAGGARRGVSTLSLNLAAPLHDGQQIVVGIAGATGSFAGGSDGTGNGPSGSSGSSGSSGASSASGGIVDLNTATLEQVETLPGVGPVLGQHILDWRAAHGQFASVDQLREVSGIGDVRFAQLRPLVST